MLFKLLDIIAGYLKETPVWPVIRPLAALAALYVTSLVMAYQFVEWQYRLSPPLWLFLRSYLAKQVTVACGAVALILFLVPRLRPATEPAATHTRAAPWYGGVRRWFTALIAVALILAGAVALFSWLAPNEVANVRVRFLTEPEVDRYAAAYVLYELNRTQKRWFFDVDFDVFDERALTSRERTRCDEGDRSLCFAEILAGGRPFIGITAEPLGEDFFWKNQGPVSVVSTYGWRQYAPPSVYEFLTHAVIVQSVLIHLNAHCSGLPEGAFRESRVSANDLFQFSPRRHAMKAAILAAHLNRRGEELLFNCFGPEYVAVASNVLTLDWLRSGRVRENLERAFGVKVQG